MMNLAAIAKHYCCNVCSSDIVLSVLHGHYFRHDPIWWKCTDNGCPRSGHRRSIRFNPPELKHPEVNDVS